jgi:hypothetical protein
MKICGELRKQQVPFGKLRAGSRLAVLARDDNFLEMGRMSSKPDNFQSALRLNGYDGNKEAGLSGLLLRVTEK